MLWVEYEIQSNRLILRHIELHVYDKRKSISVERKRVYGYHGNSGQYAYHLRYYL